MGSRWSHAHEQMREPDEEVEPAVPRANTVFQGQVQPRQRAMAAADRCRLGKSGSRFIDQRSLLETVPVCHVCSCQCCGSAPSWNHGLCCLMRWLCRICRTLAKVQFLRCNFCGASPSWHHGRCCSRRPPGLADGEGEFQANGTELQITET